MAHSSLNGWREGKAEPATAPLAPEMEAEA